MADLREVRCRSCRRYLGVTTAPTPTPTYCDRWCADDIPAAVVEARDAVMELLSQVKGYSSPQIAELFNITRQRVGKIIKDRDLRNR